MSATMVAVVRAQYGTPLTPEEAVKVCNQVAYVKNGNSAVGPWGLHRKSGNAWGGVALDIVLNGTEGIGYDILGDVEGAGSPQWNESAPPSGGWKFEPVHEDWLPADPTDPGPVPPSDCHCADELAEIQMALADILVELQAQRALLTAAAMDLAKGLDEIKPVLSHGIKIRF